jgi:hypothetical protein
MNIQFRCAECGKDLTVKASDVDLYHTMTLRVEPCECMADEGDDFELTELKDELDELSREHEDLKDAANDAVRKLGKCETIEEVAEVMDELDNAIPI